MAQDGEVENYKHEHDGYVHYQALPEVVAEEGEVYSDYNCRHQHDVRY